MIAGILAGVTWAVETIILGIALAMSPFVSTEQAVILAPFASTFLHDAFSAIWACVYNSVRGNLPDVVKALKTRSGRFVALAAVIGGPVGMTGYVLSVANMGASIGAVASAIFPAIGAVLAYFFLKEKMSWYRWVFLILSLLGVYGLSYSPEINITNLYDEGETVIGSYDAETGEITIPSGQLVMNDAEYGPIVIAGLDNELNFTDEVTLKFTKLGGKIDAFMWGLAMTGDYQGYVWAACMTTMSHD